MNIGQNKEFENEEEPEFEKCESCQDYIVCYAYNKLGRENCEDYHPDFMDYQKKWEKHS